MVYETEESVWDEIAFMRSLRFKDSKDYMYIAFLNNLLKEKFNV